MSAILRRIAVIWGFATLLMLPAFALGHIISDNSFTNVNWSEGFAQQLFSGHIYPRWLPDMNAGAGSPVFYFYGPLPFYLTAPFHLLVGKRLAVLLGMWLMLALSGQAFRALAAFFVEQRAALVASLAYMTMPYHLLVDIWLRSDFGELCAFIFMPLCLLCLFRLSAGPKWTYALAASLAGLLLSHLPSALMFAPFLTVFCFYLAFRGEFLTITIRAATAAVLGLGIAAAYVVPALQLQSLIHAANWDTYLPSQDLLFTRRNGAFEHFLDMVFAGALAVGAIYVASETRLGRWQRVLPWALFAAAALFLVSPASAWVWNELPRVFGRIQFAWRVFVLLDIALSMLFALALDSNRATRAALAAITIFALAAAMALFLTRTNHSGSDTFYRRTADAEEILIAHRVEPWEYLPSCRPFQSTDRSDGTSASIVQKVIAEKVPDELAVFDYPFLDVLLNGKVLPTKCDPKTGFIVVGLNRNALEIKTHWLQPERIGFLVSLTSLIIVMLGLIFVANTRMRSRKAN